MHWVVQENMFNERGYTALLDALVRLGIPHTIVKVIPFSHELVPPVEQTNPVVVMGAYTLCSIAREQGWSPGSFHDDKTFDFVKQYYAWGDKLFNYDAWVHDFARVPEQKEPFFIRPSGDTKSFSGQVMTWEKFVEWRDKVLDIGDEPYLPLRSDTRVVVAPLKPIACEYRLWVVDGEIVTQSLYKQGSRVFSQGDAVEPAVLDFARARIREWVPARAFCLDIFQGEDGALFIGEVNNLNAAGFYGADMQRLVAAIDSMAGY